MASGGYRPTAPQNNSGVSATGGAGSKDGVPNINYTGMAYGQNKATNDQMKSAKMGSNIPAAPTPNVSAALPNAPQLPPLTNLFAPTANPEEPITHGMSFGPGANSVPLPASIPTDRNPSMDIIKALYAQDPRNEDLRYIIESAGQ